VTLIGIVLPVFLVIGLGYALRRLRLVTEPVNAGLSRLVFYAASPALLLRSLARAELDWRVGAGMLAGVGVVSVAAALAAYVLLRRAAPARRGVIALGAFRSNTVFMGLPLVLSAYGDAALAPMGILIAFLVIVENPLAALLLTLPHQRRNARDARLWLGTLGRVLVNPLVLGAGAGVVLSLLDAAVPGPVDRALDLVGQTAAPLGLLCVGAGLDTALLRAELRAASMVAAAKLVVVPLLVLLVLRQLGLTGVALGVPVLVAACPTAVISAIMAREMRGDARLASAIVVGTTLFSLATLVGWLALLEGLAG